MRDVVWNLYPSFTTTEEGRREGIQIKLELKFIILISSNLDTEQTKERQSRNFLLVLGNYAHGQDFSDIVPALSTLRQRYKSVCLYLIQASKFKEYGHMDKPKSIVQAQP